MNTKPARRVKRPRKRHTAESLRRKTVLRAAGRTYDELADRACVSWRMVKFWLDDEKTSAPIAEAFGELIREKSA